MRKRPWLPLLALAAGLLVAAAAWAQDVAQRRAVFVWDEKQALRMSVSYRDIIDRGTIQKLMGGLPTTIVLQAYAVRESNGDTIAASFKSCKVTYDLWDEIYRIEMSQLGTPDGVVASPTLEGVLRRCTESDRLLIAQRSALAGKGSIFIGAVVEVNPVSPEMLERIRRWVNRPSVAGNRAPGDAIFGSFVGLFLARIGSADQQLRFRTQSIAP